jgi:hypothetical protein
MPAPAQGVERRARTILGLDDQEFFPAALPPRAEQLWRMDGFAADVPFTNPMFVPLGPSPDIGLVHETMAQVVARHQALRTRLTVKNGRPIQLVEDWKVSRIALVDVKRRDLDQDRPDGPASPVSEFTKSTMDLYAQDGFQVRAFRDEQGEVTLGFLAHGYFSDAWSSQVLLKEFRAIHAALENREKAAFPPAAQYIDYAQSQRRSLDADLPAHLGYWQKKLGQMPPARLPQDHHKSTGRRGRSYFFIRDEILTRLVALAAANRISLTLILLAAFQLSLARWSGQREILSAAYTADRIKPQFQGTIGFLVTNMPVCARLEPAISFRAFLADFARAFYGGYPHRELSCELYDAIFAPPQPFCATVFNFVPLQARFSASELLSLPAFDGVVAGPDGARPAIYRDIYLGVAQYPNGLLGKLFYNADLFTPQGVEIFIRHFRHVAEKLAAEPDATLRELLA